MNVIAQSEIRSVDERVKVTRVIHTIHATTDIAQCRQLYLDKLGGLIFAEGYFEQEDRDMALLYVANHMVEPMAARDSARTDKAFARYLQQFGQGFHSFEIKVEDGAAAGRRLEAAGCKLVSNYGYFFFVRAESTGGILIEACDIPMPNDPHDRASWREDWGTGLPHGIVRLDHIACVTANLNDTLHFFTRLLDGSILVDERIALPQPGRRVEILLGDTHIAFVQPDDAEEGPLTGFLAAPNTGIYALVWAVADVGIAEQYFLGKNLRITRQGCVADGFAIHPDDFLGARHEFTSSATTATQ
jgi:catechol 2,3-dioxygenase-like lactoylglutathione lyase family enzyme